jgi:dTDP-4-amino-4,6-dideoxygalactose transaminase|tara:strand:- start:6165 stop:6779 length:615 start_codon:yes stop_codon:yes gene_type:complete
MRHSPYKIVKMFEETVADYCGSKYAVSTDSCTDAILICCEYFNVSEVTIPCRTYLSIPQSIMHAGGTVKFREYLWKGIYQLEPYPIWDAAKRFTSNMYIPDSYMCLSFHIKKNLKIGKGGMILTDDKKAADFFRRARYEGRGEVLYHEDVIEYNGYNAYMTPEQAARGLSLMQHYPEHVEDVPEEPFYKDLRNYPLFKDCELVD